MRYKIIFIFLSLVALQLGCKPSGPEMQANPQEQTQEQKPPALALHEAAVSGNIPSMELLLEHGADIHAVNEQGFTPLEMALQANQERSVQALLQHGASSQDLAQNGRPLWVAYAGTMTPGLMTMMFPDNASAEEVYEALSGAIAYNPYELTVNFLLEKAKTFPDFASRCFWPAALVSQNQSIVDSLLIRNVLPLNGCPNTDEEPPLVAAVRQGKDKLVASLLLLGANVTQRDKAGYTASYYALKSGNKELSDKLVAEEERIRAEEYAAVLARKKAAARKRAGKGECVIRREDGSTVPCPTL